MAAFRLALEQGAQMLEFDVRLSQDDQLMIGHDSSLRRTAGADGRVETRTRAELAALDVGGWFHERFRGERMPTLAEVLEFVDGRVGLDIELKTRGGAGPRARMMAAVAKVLRPRLGRQDFVISSFDGAAIDLLWAEYRDLPAARIYSRATTPPAADDPSDVAILEHPLATPGFVEACHRRGRKVWVWTVDEPADMRRLVDIGVDGICSNRPGKLLEVLQT